MQPNQPDEIGTTGTDGVTRSGAPLQPVQRTAAVQPNATQSNPVQANPNETAQRQAAANMTRSQIDQIYANDSPYKQFETGQASTSPYERTHAPESELTADDHFKRYHSAWQDYYQKYYESYYTQAVRQTQAQLKMKAELEKSTPTAVYGKEQPQTPADTTETSATAVKKLQTNLQKKVRDRAGKVRHSRHFWPLITAVTVASVFLFLQYNRLLIANVAAFVSPGSVDPQNIILDPSSDTKVGPENKLIIPKINVDAPAIYSVTTYDNNQIEAQLKNGVVHYPIPGANAVPGQVGNTVIGGHSSNDVFDDGGYKFVFVQLEKLVVGDTFYLNYNGTRYTYHVTKTATIEPTQIDVLTAKTDKPLVTLVTCTPVGTALHRFIVTGEQVSPDPSGATAADNSAQSTSSTIPGNSPTLVQRILGQ